MKKILTAEQTANIRLAGMRKALVYPRKGGENRHGWKRVPAICEMNITLGEENEYLRKINIKKKTGTKLDFQDVSHNEINKYVTHQIRRLKHARDSNNYQLYWRIVKYSLLHSKSFRITAFNKVFDGWWHKLDISHVFLILKRSQHIITKLATNLDFRRVYLPKEDTFRPLGVPSSEWRLVMHMMNNFITMWVRPELEEWNHGFLPQKGTNTCITEVVKMLGENKYVYEFDFKQFFPSVDISEVTEFLKSRNVPNDIVRWIDQINRSTPALPKEKKLEETSSFRYHLSKEQPEEEIDFNHPAFNMLKILPFREMMAEDGYTDVRLWMRDQLGLLDQMQVKFTKTTELYKAKDIDNNLSYTSMYKPLGGLDTPCVGLPQGLNTSPILSLVILIKWVKEMNKLGIKVLMYADDGFLYSNKPFLPTPPSSENFIPTLSQPFAPSNIQFNEKKSRWVRTPDIIGDNFIMKGLNEPVKFLGVLIDTENQTIEGKTRSGSTLKLGTKGHNLIKLLRHLVTTYKDCNNSKLANESDLVLLTRSGIHGYVLSRLYQNSWKDVKYEEQDWVHKVKSWLGVRERCKQHPTRSSDAIPFLYHLVSKSMNIKWRPTKSFYKNFYEKNIEKMFTDQERPRDYRDFNFVHHRTRDKIVERYFEGKLKEPKMSPKRAKEIWSKTWEETKNDKIFAPRTE